MLDRGVPPSGRLEMVALYLADRQQHRQVILFVEQWAKHSPPTDPAQLALANAYARMRLLDRASVHLQRLTPEGRRTVAAEHLTAEILLLRGSTKRALKVASLGLQRSPEDPVFARVAEQARDRPFDPDEPGPADDSVGSVVARAEAFMARGSLVRAQAILEQARRDAMPRKIRRVEDLLWALRGDFGTDASLAALCDRFSPSSAEGFEATEQATMVVEEDHASTISPDRFPTLFREQPPMEHTTAVRDQTQVSRMAATAELIAEPTITRERTHPRHRDTEVLMVVPRTSIHSPRPSVPEGLELPPPHPSEPADDPVVVRTFHATEATTSPGAEERRVMDVGMHKHLERDAIRQHAADLEREARRAARAARRKARASAPAPPPLQEAPKVLTAQDLEEASTMPWWVGVLVALGAAAVATFAAIMFAAAT